MDPRGVAQRNPRGGACGPICKQSRTAGAGSFPRGPNPQRPRRAWLLPLPNAANPATPWRRVNGIRPPAPPRPPAHHLGEQRSSHRRRWRHGSIAPLVAGAAFFPCPAPLGSHGISPNVPCGGGFARGRPHGAASVHDPCAWRRTFLGRIAPLRASRNSAQWLSNGPPIRPQHRTGCRHRMTKHGYAGVDETDGLLAMTTR